MTKLALQTVAEIGSPTVHRHLRAVHVPPLDVVRKTVIFGTDTFRVAEVAESLSTDGAATNPAPADGYAQVSYYSVTLSGPLQRKQGGDHATRVVTQRVTGGNVRKLPKALRDMLYGPERMVRFFEEPTRG